MELRVVPKQDLVKYKCVVKGEGGGRILSEAYLPSVERRIASSPSSLHHEDVHITCCLTTPSKLHRFHSEYTRNATLRCHLPSVVNHHNLVFITLQILPSILSTPYVKKCFLAESRMGFSNLSQDWIPSRQFERVLCRSVV